MEDKNVKAVNNYTDEEREAINSRIDNQYKKIIADGKYKELLLKCGANSKYSVSNIMLMLEQDPNMTIAKGMNEWIRDGRHIKEGAKSIEITAPTKVEYEVIEKDENNQPKLDAETKKYANRIL